MSSRSTAASGSSSRSRRGCVAIARASATRCRSPPESVDGKRSSKGAISRIETASSKADSRAPFIPNRTLRRTSRCGKRHASCGTYPIRRRSGGRKVPAAVSIRTSPSIAIRPEACRRRPAIVSRSDVFPEPDGPRMATAGPARVADTRSGKRARGSATSRSSITRRSAATGVASGSRWSRRLRRPGRRRPPPAASPPRRPRSGCAGRWRGRACASGPGCSRRSGSWRRTLRAPARTPEALRRGSRATPEAARRDRRRRPGPLPSERAIPSRRGSTSSKAASAGRTSSGNDITAVASTTAFQVKSRSMPASVEQPPDRTGLAQQLQEQEARRPSAAGRVAA